MLDKVWANEELRWFIGFLKEDTWKNHPENKIFIALNIEDLLRCAGFEWQADRVLNHLHKWMVLQRRNADTPKGEEEVH